MAKIPKYTPNSRMVEGDIPPALDISAPYAFRFQHRGRDWEAKRLYKKATCPNLKLWVVGTVGESFTPLFTVEALPNTEENANHPHGVYTQIRQGLALYSNTKTWSRR